MGTQTWAVRLLLVAVLVAPWGLVLLMPKQPKLEYDLDRVYESLQERPEYADLSKWCGLRHTPATAEEADQLNDFLMSAPDIEEHFCYFGIRSRDLARAASHSERFRWVRLHHPTDPTRWIGIGVLNHYNMGAGFQDYVVFRVRIGF